MPRKEYRVAICSRKGVTLLELIIVIAIIGLLLSFILTGVMRVRETALITQSKNNLRQIVLGIHHFDSVQRRLPVMGYSGAEHVGRTYIPRREAPPLFLRVLPYMEGQNAVNSPWPKFPTVSFLLSPSDPSASEALAKNAPVTSYAANGRVFVGFPRLATTFQDGTSNTIAFAEHYACNCNGMSFPYSQNERGHPTWYGDRIGHRPAFADTGDVIPVTQENPPVTGPSSRPGAPVKTFQVAPSIRSCNFFVPQTPHTSGMLVAMADGGVRQLAPSISPSVFWGAVTPAGREILGNEW
jgi:prepilin-type N-terminal cleavage/methylation domain-containing protein